MTGMVHDVGSVTGLVAVTDGAWVVVSDGGVVADVVGWAVVVTRRASWVVDTAVRPVAVCRLCGVVGVVGGCGCVDGERMAVRRSERVGDMKAGS